MFYAALLLPAESSLLCPVIVFVFPQSSAQAPPLLCGLPWLPWTEVCTLLCTPLPHTVSKIGQIWHSTTISVYTSAFHVTCNDFCKGSSHVLFSYPENLELFLASSAFRLRENKHTHLYRSHPSQRTRNSLSWKLCVAAPATDKQIYEYLTIFKIIIF